MCLSCICLLAMRTLICVTFSLPPGVRGWLRPLLVALSGFSVYSFVYLFGYQWEIFVSMVTKKRVKFQIFNLS